MANFHTHVGFSTMLGCGYTAVGLAYGVPIDASLVAGGLCGVSGMLPDIDSDNGIPLRETSAAAAAVVPMLLVDRMQQLGLSYHSMVLAAGSIYVIIRFGISKALARYTVHRGMFHSIPAAVVFAGAAFLICGCSNLYFRYYNAGGVFLGVMSHLILDELYSVEWARGRFRLKRSSGTALKLWGRDAWGNLSVYAKLAVVAALILAEPAVMERYGTPHPLAFLRENVRLPGRPHDAAAPSLGRETTTEERVDTPSPGERQQYPFGSQFAPRWHVDDETGGDSASSPPPPPPRPTDTRDRSVYDTARRFWKQFAE